MKTILAVLLALSCALVARAQDPTKHDPLVDQWGGYPMLANSVEIVSVSDSLTTSKRMRFPRVLDFSTGTVLVEATPTIVDMSGPPGVSEDLWMDCLTGDFDGDMNDELLVAWVDPAGRIFLEWSSATRNKPSQQWQWNSKSLYTIWGSGGMSQIRLRAANLDGRNPLEVIVFGHHMSAGYPQVEVFGLRYDTTSRGFVGLFQDYMPSGMPFDVATGDLDGNGRDEIMHVFYRDDGSYKRMNIFQWYYTPSTGRLGFSGGTGVPGTVDQWATWKRLKVTVGDFRNIGHAEGVVSLTVTSASSGRQAFNYITYSGGVPKFQFTLPGVSPPGWTWGQGWESDAVAADLNPFKHDGDELVVAGPGEVAILKFDNAYNPYYVAGGTAKLPFLNPNAVDNRERRRFVAVGDMDPDTSNQIWVPEIVVAERKMDSTTVFRVLTPTVNVRDSITGLTQKAVISPGRKSRKTEIALGDMDGDAMRLGAPKLVGVQNFYQPIVMLNVPPTHFDTLGGRMYDICKVHGATKSEFEVSYTEKNSQASHFETEVNHSWGASAEISGGFSAFGFKVKAYAKASYERGYYGSSTVDTTTTASQVTTSYGDDWILATVTDLDFWEYPVYALGRKVGDFMVQIPNCRGTHWFSTRNVIARDWMADREVGNLFSYPSASRISAWAGANLLTSFTGKYISTASAGSWTLDLATQSIDASKLKHNVNAEVGLSVKKWGVEAKVSGKYAYEEIKTHTSTATKEVLIEVKVSDTDKSFGDTDYLVTPFIYWGQNGALVIDYAVDPSTIGDPVLGTFWDQKYLAKPDPALILPWRLDPLKGIGETDNIRLYCRSLHVSPMAPVAGDNVHITANVHNYSLKNTAGPVTVRFYLGNPAAGGIPIVGTGGFTDVTTAGPIPARERATLEMDWVLPGGLDNTARVYAVVDPANAIDEIHEDNNVGFVALRVGGAVGVEEEPAPVIPSSYTLQQNYPNPFNPATVIRYDLPTRAHVTLTVYDILGRPVATLVDDIRDAGQQHALFDGKGLASGMYLYRLEARPIDAGSFTGFASVKKMLIVR